MHGFDPGSDDSSTQKGLESEHRPGDAFYGPVVLLNAVIAVFVLTHQDIDASVSLDTFNGGRIGATLVDGDLLWQAM